MTTDAQQVTEDYEQLKELLELYPNISIVKTEGQPPNTYEIEYILRGYIKEGNATIGIGQTHRVRLHLPFGYPHFPPTAKPLTPVFHPDFDPAAIRLANFWQQNPSLPELVLHIGEMICGSVYNLEDPFNQEAAEWYKKQRAKLPLDTVSIADIEIMDTDIDELDDAVASTFVQSTDQADTTLFDYQSHDDLTALQMERKDAADPRKPTGSTTDIIQHILSLIEDNKIFTANELLAELPADAPFPDREAIQIRIGKVLRKTDQLFKLVEQLEGMSKLDEAMEVVNGITGIASDAPELDTVRDRIQWALQMAPPAAAPSKPGKRTAAPSDAQQAPLPPPAAKLKLTGKSFAWLGAIPFKPIGAAILIAGTAILVTFLYFKDQDALRQSQANMLQGQMLIEKKQFEQAATTLEEAKAILSDMTILRFFHKSSQEQAINDLLASSALQEGLLGRVLHQGEYVPASVVADYEKLTAMTDQAQSLVEQDKIDEALGLYRHALRFAIARNLVKPQAAINEIIQSLEMRQALAAAEKCEREGNWDCAAAAYRKAVTLSGNMMDQGAASDITSRMTAANFRHELDQSKKAFTQSQWQTTIKYLEQAQQAIDINPNVVSEKERQDLHRLLTNSRLLLMLSTAREAFQQKNWNQAIQEYQNALNLLAREPDIRENSNDESLGKIEKTLLMVKIAQIQDQATKDEKTEDIAANLARYKDIQALINASAHQNDPAVKNVAQQLADKIGKQQELLLQREKIAWLEGHFEDIFRANYPTFKNSKFSLPKAVFTKKIGSRLVFTLTCLERSQGSSSKLELHYQFDTSSGKWSVHHD